MKKKYMKPSLMTIKLQHSGIVCTSDPSKAVPLWDGEAGVKEQGKTNVEDYNVWDDDWRQ